MPFTFSHPAIVLPLKYLPKKWISMTGLVMGSMAPDFEKFIKMEPGNTFSHTWHGLFWFNVPFGILLAFVYHLIIRDQLLDHLPVFLRKRLYRFRGFDWRTYFKKNYGAVALSVLIGATSHLAWDSITHLNGRLTWMRPFLVQKFYLAGTKVTIYAIFDNICSVAGLLFIFFFLMRLQAMSVPFKPDSSIRRYWLLVAVFAGAVMALRLLSQTGFVPLMELLIISISAVMLGILVSSIVVKHTSWAKV
ncbi:DUF4184 family protein [Pontibacter liquoris]|uniref:DUF4184 family protein n=1 Tax=Pontibacter liquoris TaxID=2905677 RepID=UPI001FA7AB12|nr:DUF4184 family protein [Pontibacter liquoris]